ncbi:MAG: hypothetical protein ACOC0D_04280 [Spirochaeta sp.]
MRILRLQRRIARGIGCTAAFLLVTMSAGAITLTDFEVVEREQADGHETLFLQNTDGITIEYRRPLDHIGPADQHVQNLEGVLHDLQILELDSVSVLQHTDSLEVMILPLSFEFDGHDLNAFLPAGIQLYIGEALEYDFRMVVDEYFLRITGDWFGESSLAETLARAVENPQAFVRSRDPEALLQRVLSAEQRLDEQRAHQRDLEQRLDDIYSRHTDLQEQYDETVRYVTYLQDSMLAEHTRGFFGGLNLPDPEMVEQVRLLRSSNPDVTFDNLRSLAENEGYSVSKRELGLILSIFFNEIHR